MKDNQLRLGMCVCGRTCAFFFGRGEEGGLACLFACWCSCVRGCLCACAGYAGCGVEVVRPRKLLVYISDTGKLGMELKYKDLPVRHVVVTAGFGWCFSTCKVLSCLAAMQLMLLHETLS